MEVYLLANNKSSRTNGRVIVTIKLLKQTDMSGFTPKKKLNVDFYYPYKINCGRVVKITDLNNVGHFLTASIKIPGLKIPSITIQSDKYIAIKHHAYDSDKLKAFVVYKYKHGVLNETGHVSAKFTGAHYIYYTDGKIREKIDYKDGKVCTRNLFYQNAYNSRKSCMVFNPELNVIEHEYIYDNKENLVCKNVFSSDGAFLQRNVYDGGKPRTHYRAKARGSGTKK